MKIVKCLGIIGLGFILGVGATYQSFNNDNISINGRRVKVVDVMYTYTLESGEVVEGDYSLSVNSGYEYSVDGSYHKEYENAKVRK